MKSLITFAIVVLLSENPDPVSVNNSADSAVAKKWCSYSLEEDTAVCYA